jgi:ABC-type tungstate transport system substrate-binding protein
MKRIDVLLVAILTGLVVGLFTEPFISIPVVASIERSALESIDLHLEECIRQFQAGYAKNAITHCEISEQELDALLQNMTVTE